MAAVETFNPIDAERLSSFLDIDALDLQTILDSAAEGVLFLLQQVQVKATEFEEINNSKTQLEVNYGISFVEVAELTGQNKMFTQRMSKCRV
jgi:hypothetical protein